MSFINQFKKNHVKISYLMLFLILILLSIWSIDMSVSLMINGGGYLTNGFWDSSPIKIYHVALYLLVFSVFCICLMYIYNLLEGG